MAQTLRLKAEEAKKQLSTQDQFTFQIDDTELTITKNELNHSFNPWLIKPLIVVLMH